MKKWLILLSVLMVTILVFSACGQQTQTPSQTSTSTATAPASTSKPAPTTSTAPASTSKPPSPTSTAAPGAKILKLASTMGKTGGTGQAFDWFAKEVGIRTNGRYTVDYYPGQTLFKAAETMSSIKAGVVDVSHITIGVEAKSFPVSQLIMLPSTHFPQTKAGMIAATAAHWELFNKYPVMKNEMKDYEEMPGIVASAYLTMTKKTKISVPDDLKGLKIGCEAAYFDIVKSVGGIPVAIVPPDMYPALDKGVVDGVMTGFEQQYALRLDEVLNNFYEYYFSSVVQVAVWNKESWNSLPPDVQKIMTDLAPQLESFAMDRCVEQVKAGQDRIKAAAGKTIIVPTAEQMKLWDKLAALPDDVWLNNMKTAGVSEAPEMIKLLKQRSADAWSQNK